MAAGGYSRRQRAPKPLRVPLVVALIGLVIFLVSMAIASAYFAGLGLIFFFWGAASFATLAILRWNRRRAA